MLSGRTIIQAILKFLQWLLSLFFVLGGIAVVAQKQTVGGAFAFAIGILLFPPFKGLWQKLPFIAKPWMRGVAIFLLLICMSITMPGNKRQTDKRETKVTLVQPKVVDIKEEAKTNESEIIKVKSKGIAGISAVDIYGNFEKIGFKTKKNINTETALWTSSLIENGIEYTVDTYSQGNIGDIVSVDLTALRTEPQYNSENDLRKFLKYGASIPYDGADIEKAQNFIDDNFYNDKASIIISNVRFTIYVPTKFARMLTIENE